MTTGIGRITARTLDFSNSKYYWLLSEFKLVKGMKVPLACIDKRVFIYVN
ncbi:MAG TPA: hypothetical protein VIP70_10025 [Nitrososphaeraceae archaeon]